MTSDNPIDFSIGVDNLSEIGWYGVVVTLDGYVYRKMSKFQPNEHVVSALKIKVFWNGTRVLDES